MAHLLRYEEWQGACGNWYCNDTKELGGKNSVASLWYTPARMLGISPAAYIQLLIEKFEVDNIYYGGFEYWDAGVLIFSWKSQNKMRKFKNWLNAEARKRNFIC